VSRTPLTILALTIAGTLLAACETHAPRHVQVQVQLRSPLTRLAELDGWPMDTAELRCVARAQRRASVSPRGMRSADDGACEPQARAGMAVAPSVAGTASAAPPRMPSRKRPTRSRPA